MKVLFIKDNLPTAMAGEIKEVKPGFARNFLIPQGIAERANRSSIERIDKLKREAEIRRGDMKKRWQRVATDISSLELEIVAQTGPTGKLFGSVTSSQIASAIEENLDDVVIDRRSIRISEPIKLIGNYNVPVKLFEGVEGEIKILVKSDGNVLTEEMIEISEGAPAEANNPPNQPDASEPDASEPDASEPEVDGQEEKEKSEG
jgi:large subunit ribosomal protein L9